MQVLCPLGFKGPKLPLPGRLPYVHSFFQFAIVFIGRYNPYLENVVELNSNQTTNIYCLICTLENNWLNENNTADSAIS